MAMKTTASVSLPRASRPAPVVTATVTPARFSDAAINTAHLLILLDRIAARVDSENGNGAAGRKLEGKDTNPR